MAEKKAETSKKDYIKVTQTRSAIGRAKDQKGTLIGLRLNKIGRSNRLPATSEILGMVNKVKHLVKVENL